MTIAVLAIPLGRIADIFGKAKMYILGLVIFGGGSVLCAFANTGDFLIFFSFYTKYWGSDFISNKYGNWCISYAIS